MFARAIFTMLFLISSLGVEAFAMTSSDPEDQDEVSAAGGEDHPPAPDDEMPSAVPEQKTPAATTYPPEGAPGEKMGEVDEERAGTPPPAPLVLTGTPVLKQRDWEAAPPPPPPPVKRLRRREEGVEEAKRSRRHLGLGAPLLPPAIAGRIRPSDLAPSPFPDSDAPEGDQPALAPVPAQSPMQPQYMRLCYLKEITFLGSGHFGDVRLGLLDGVPTVVKTFRQTSEGHPPNFRTVKSEFTRQRTASAAGAAPAPLYGGPFYLLGSDERYRPDTKTLKQYIDEDLKKHPETHQNIIRDLTQLALAGKGFSHANIDPRHILVRLGESGEVYSDLDAQLAFAMVPIEGARSLSAFAKETHPDRENLLKSLADRALLTLMQLHRYGVHHNDIAPGNILVVGNNKDNIDTKLVDFGVSDDDAGNPQYHARESFGLKNLAIRDMISLATVLLELVGLYDSRQHKNSKLPLSEIIQRIEQSPYSQPFKLQVIALLNQEDSKPISPLAQFEAAHPELYSPPGNGTCFWGALSYALNAIGVVHSPLVLQQMALVYMQNHFDEFVNFFPGSTEEEQLYWLKQYMLAHSNPGTWATAPIILAATSVLHLDLTMHHHTPNGELATYHFVPNEEDVHLAHLLPITLHNAFDHFLAEAIPGLASYSGPTLSASATGPTAPLAATPFASSLFRDRSLSPAFYQR